MTLAKLGGNKSLKILLPRFQALYSVFEIVDFFNMLPVNFVSDDEVMKQLLRETPQGLIKFQIYSKKDEQRFADRRLNRVKNKNAIPLGPWAHTVIEGLFNE